MAPTGEDPELSSSGRAPLRRSLCEDSRDFEPSRFKPSSEGQPVYPVQRSRVSRKPLTLRDSGVRPARPIRAEGCSTCLSPAYGISYAKRIGLRDSALTTVFV